MRESSAPPSAAAIHGAFGGCILIWGSTFLFIAIGNDTVPPVWGATLRVAIAAVILLAVMGLRREALPRGPELRTAGVYGLLQFGVNLPLLYLAETQVPSSLAAVIFATIPLATAFLARAAGLEPLDRSRVGGAVIALLGIVVLFSGDLRTAVPTVPLLALIGAILAACVGAVVLKRGPRPSPVSANAVGNVVGFAACLAWSAAIGERWSLPGSWNAALPILYLALLGSVGAFVMWAWLVEHWDLTRASYIAVITPLVALTLGAVFRHERLGGAGLAGALMVLAGVAVGMRIARPVRH